MKSGSVQRMTELPRFRTEKSCRPYYLYAYYRPLNENEALLPVSLLSTVESIIRIANLVDQLRCYIFLLAIHFPVEVDGTLVCYRPLSFSLLNEPLAATAG